MMKRKKRHKTIITANELHIQKNVDSSTAHDLQRSTQIAAPTRQLKFKHKNFVPAHWSGVVMKGREYEPDRECWLKNNLKKEEEECWLQLQGDKATSYKSFDSTLESQEFPDPGEVRVHTTALILWSLNFLERLGSLEHGPTHMIGRRRYHDTME